MQKKRKQKPPIFRPYMPKHDGLKAKALRENEALRAQLQQNRERREWLRSVREFDDD